MFNSNNIAYCYYLPFAAIVIIIYGLPLSIVVV